MNTIVIIMLILVIIFFICVSSMFISIKAWNKKIIQIALNEFKRRSK